MAKAAKRPSKQAMHGNSGRADTKDTEERFARRNAAMTAVAERQQARKARIVRQPILRREANDNNPMREMEVLVETMLKEAADVIRRMSASAGSFPASAGSGWPPVVRDYWESAKYSIRNVSRPRTFFTMKKFSAYMSEPTIA